MTLIRWEPFGTLPSLLRRGRFPADFEGNLVEWAPSTDISETDDEYLIRAELPAVKKEDVRVTADNGMLTIEGERKQTTENRNERFHRVESSYGSFTRSFSLPDNVDTDAIRCESRDGVLTIHVPKAKTEKQKSRQIKVE
jgi:HSP20 family protein